METPNVTTAAAIATPFCGKLRSKKFFMLNVIPTKVDDFIDASGHCWCYDTQTVRGPDEGFVEPERCVPGRACYRSAFEVSKQARGAK